MVGTLRKSFIFEALVSANPPSITTLAFGTIDVSVPGVVTGKNMRVQATLQAQPSVNVVLAAAFVQATDTVRLVFFNPTAGTLDAAALNVAILAYAPR
jgi:hypothetical protein